MKLKFDGKSSITMLIVGGILGLGISGMVYGIKWDQKMQEAKICEEDSFENSKRQSESYEPRDWNNNEWKNKDWNENDWKQWGEDVGEYWEQWGENVGEYWENYGENAAEYWSDYGQKLASNITNDVMNSVKNNIAFEKDCLLSREEAEKIARKYIEEQTGKKLDGCEMDLYLNKWSGLVNQGEWKGSIVVDETNRYGFTIDVKTEKVTECNAYTRNKKGQAWKRKNSSGQIEQIIDEKFEYFDKVDINIDCGMNVCLTEGKDFGIKHYQLGENYKLDYEVKGDTLCISQKINGKFLKYNEQDDCLLCVTVPEGTILKSAEVNVDTGNVDIISLQAEMAKTNVDTGNINIEDCKVDELSISVDTGNAFINEAKLKKGTINNDTGNTFVEDVEATQFLECAVEMGNIFLEGKLKGDISAHTNMGNVFNNSKESKDCNLKTKAEMGNVF